MWWNATILTVLVSKITLITPHLVLVDIHHLQKVSDKSVVQSLSLIAYLKKNAKNLVLYSSEYTFLPLKMIFFAIFHFKSSISLPLTISSHKRDTALTAIFIQPSVEAQWNYPLLLQETSYWSLKMCSKLPSIALKRTNICPPITQAVWGRLPPFINVRTPIMEICIMVKQQRQIEWFCGFWKIVPSVFNLVRK